MSYFQWHSQSTCYVKGNTYKLGAETLSKYTAC